MTRLGKYNHSNGTELKQTILEFNRLQSLDAIAEFNQPHKTQDKDTCRNFENSS